MFGPSARALLPIIAALLVPGATRAQSVVGVCADCMVGVYDDAQMTRTTGTMGAFQVKSVYLGVRLAPGMRVANLTFDAIYPVGFAVLDVTSYIPDAQYVPHGDGIKVDWPRCIGGTQALFRVRIFTFGAVHNAVLQLRNAEIGACQNPQGQRWRVASGCFVLNPSGPPVGCAVTIQPTTWSMTKALFK